MTDPTDVQTLLAELEAERAELDVTIAHLRRRLGIVPTGDAAGTPTGTAGPLNAGRDAGIVTGRVRPDEFFRLSISNAIMKFLAIMKQPQNPMAIVNGLRAGGVLTNAKNFYTNVNTELKRMKDRELVVNTPSGWGLAEWYPQKPRQLEDQPKKRKRKGAKKGGAKSAAKPKAGDKQTWASFAGGRMKAGKTMKEAAAEWAELRAQRGE